MVLLMFAALAACTRGSDTGADAVPSAELAVQALSCDEAVAVVSLDQAATLRCEQLSFEVQPGHSNVYMAGFPEQHEIACTLGTASASFTTWATTSAGVVLFDAGHGEQSGNADWVIDDDVPNPSPANPTSPESWTGAYSSFGYDLYQLGYTLRSTTSTLSASALADVQVLVLPEPNQSLSSSEEQAVVDFVKAGGGLVLISDHHGSDRDWDGVDSTDIADSLLAALGANVQQATESVDVYEEQNTTSLQAIAGDPIIHGRSGDVDRFDIYAASAFTVGGLPGSRVVIALPGYTLHDSGAARVAAAWVGQGRVFLVSDSAAADDGTGASGEDLYESWTEEDNAALYLNGVDWAAGVR